MLLSISELVGCMLQGEDGEIGPCVDVLLDDESLVVRYFVTDTHVWLPGRKVLVSPLQMGQPNLKDATVPVRLTRARVQRMPVIGLREPVCRQVEARWAEYFGYRPYWATRNIWAPTGFGGAWVPQHPLIFPDRVPVKEQQPSEIHLHSYQEVLGSCVHALDGDLGCVVDVVVDTQHWGAHTWVIQSELIPQRRVALPAELTEAIDWPAHMIDVGSSCEAIANVPEYASSQPW